MTNDCQSKKRAANDNDNINTVWNDGIPQVGYGFTTVNNHLSSMVTKKCNGQALHRLCRGKPISYSSDKIATFQPMVYKVCVVNTYSCSLKKCARQFFRLDLKHTVMWLLLVRCTSINSSKLPLVQCQVLVSSSLMATGKKYGKLVLKKSTSRVYEQVLLLRYRVTLSPTGI